MLSFEGISASPEILAGVRAGEITAFCLFADKNVRSLEQLRDLTLSLHTAARQGGQPPPIIGIDQEGGQLIAIQSGATELPGNMALGATRSAELAYSAGQVLARELRALGINLNFAPVMDVNTNPLNPVIGVRAFADDPALVAELGTALFRGIQAEGVLASAKHFPGHGDSVNDTHSSTARVDFSRQRIDSVELAPFRAAISAGIASILTGHVVFSEFDDENPASVSPEIVQGLLREQLGYAGLIITDAMDMYAVSQRGAETCVRDALGAGNDLILLGHLPGQLGMLKTLKMLEDPQALRRIAQARQSLPTELLPLDVIGSAEHQAIARQIAEQSITLVKDEIGQIPLRLSAEQKIIVLQPRPRNLTPADTSASVEIRLGAEVQARHANTQIMSYDSDLDALSLAEILAQCTHADVVIVGSISTYEAPQQAKLVRALSEQGKNPIAVALRTPYDLMDYPAVSCYLCTYTIRPVSMAALARVLFGEILACGVLPCAIPDSHRM